VRDSISVGRQTRYKPDGQPDRLTGFHQADIVVAESEVDANGYLVAHAVRFVRRASPEEWAEILQSPEVMQRWGKNVIGAFSIDPAQDDRKLDFVAKPKAMTEGGPPGSHLADDDMVALIRTVNQAFDRLPNLRAKQVTSLFRSSSKPIKWVPDSVVAAEIAYEEGRESYSDIHIDGKRPDNAPATGDSEYIRSLDKEWSTGDFTTISHCIFSALEDSDFRKVRTEQGNKEDLAVFEFTGRRTSTCIGVEFRSQIAFPTYKGLLNVRAQTGEVLHVESEASEMPPAFPIDRAERSVDFDTVEIGGERYLLPLTG
jgi:hypothetical protein